jgi:hypothetical protein
MLNEVEQSRRCTKMRTQMCLWVSRLGHGGERRGQPAEIHSKVEEISRVQQGNNSPTQHIGVSLPWTTFAPEHSQTIVSKIKHCIFFQRLLGWSDTPPRLHYSVCAWFSLVHLLASSWVLLQLCRVSNSRIPGTMRTRTATPMQMRFSSV